MKSLSRSFTWRFDSPASAVWPALADTARFNEAAGLPKHAIEERPQPDGSVRFFAQARMGPFRLAWEDVPAEWVEGEWLRHLRLFSAGPLASLCATLELRPEGERRCVAHYRVEAAPAGPLGWALLRTGFFPAVERRFAALAAGVRDWAAGRCAAPYAAPLAALDQAGRARLDAAVARIEASGNGHGLARRLADWVLAAQQTDLQRIRPLALARAWAAPERHLVELCLQAVKDGLLELRWDLLCPRCRGAALSVASLDRLPGGTHCGACNVAYGRDFAKNVELTFRPAPTLRRVDPGEFCLFDPMSTPHVKAQVTVAPGEVRTLPAHLPPGPYRLRSLEPGGSADIDHAGGPFPGLVAAEGAVTAGEPAGDGRLRLVNRETRPRTLIVESREWVRDALTAHRATTLQTFRELFADAALRPGDETGIAQVTLLFTDLKGSTALYERVGDPAAYGIVREHFAYLGQIVRRHDGAVVKTIGDSVMAAFSEPADGVRAALEGQAGIADFNARAGGIDLVIRMGLHAGPCIAVTLNDRLDYFGTTVNLAARLEAESAGGDVVLSEALARDPAVAPLLAGHALRREVRPIRGFGAPVAFCRLAGPQQAAA